VLRNTAGSSLFTFFAKHAIVFLGLNANIILTVLLNWQMFYCTDLNWKLSKVSDTQEHNLFSDN
jgi:hypothetical protein